MSFSRALASLLRIFGVGALREKGPLGLQVTIYCVAYDPCKRNLVVCRDPFQELVLLLREADRCTNRAFMRAAVMAFCLSPHGGFPELKSDAPFYTTVVSDCGDRGKRDGFSEALTAG
jgi:hypothetical protein